MAEIAELMDQFKFCKKSKIQPSAAIVNIQEHLGKQISNAEMVELIYFLFDIVEGQDKKIRDLKEVSGIKSCPYCHSVKYKTEGTISAAGEFRNKCSSCGKFWISDD